MARPLGRDPRRWPWWARLPATFGLLTSLCLLGAAVVAWRSHHGAHLSIAWGFYVGGIVLLLWGTLPFMASESADPGMMPDAARTQLRQRQADRISNFGMTLVYFLFGSALIGLGALVQLGLD